ncbi:MAG: hypothetical protein L0Z70_01995, partial [Chloroflexi bacterium]|nr:hypothetical protein [Chloroflexota bacterium]
MRLKSAVWRRTPRFFMTGSASPWEKHPQRLPAAAPWADEGQRLPALWFLTGRCGSRNKTISPDEIETQMRRELANFG